MPYRLTRQDFDPEFRNEHFLLFLTSQGLQEGDEIQSFDYDLWISEHAASFKKEHDLRALDSIGLIPDWKPRFTEYLRRRTHR